MKRTRMLLEIHVVPDIYISVDPSMLFYCFRRHLANLNSLVPRCRPLCYCIMRLIRSDVYVRSYVGYKRGFMAVVGSSDSLLDYMYCLQWSL